NLPHKKLRGDMQCTFSGGVAFQLPDDADVNTMLKRADEALYNAKHAGRNHVILG
ncbi:MAG: diguanylate cyclase, partial [Arenimonas sp.]|nr:diguanylate cyclase [Arenimonas sp.]